MTTADQLEWPQGTPLFELAFRAVSEGMNGVGVLAAGDMEVTATANANEISVATGDLWVPDSTHSIGSAETHTLSDNTSGSDRWDTVVFDTGTGASAVKEGTAAADPEPPDLASGEILLAYIYVPDGATDTPDSRIHNWRAFSTDAADVRLDDSPGRYSASNVEDALVSDLQFAVQLTGYPIPIGDLNNPYGLDELTDMDVDGSDLTDSTTTLYESANGWFRNEVVQALANFTADEQFASYPLPIGDLDSPFALPSITDMDAGGNDLVDGATTIWDTSAGEIPRTSMSDEYDSVSVSSNTTSSGEEVAFIDPSGGAVTYTLASADARDAKQIIVMDDAGAAGTNTITVDTEGSETIEGASSKSISDDWGAIVFQSNGTNWRVVAEISGTLTDTRTDVSDDGTTVVSDTSDINFSTNLSVSDDGDGTVTVTASSGSDTHTDVSDDGTTVVTSTDDINFSTDIGVTDDGDGTVTVNGEATAETVRGRGNTLSGGYSFGTNPGAFGALFDMVVDSNSAQGTTHSYLFALDGTTLLRFYAESDGAGGLQNVEVRVLQVLAVGDDIVTTGGTTIWDSTNGEVPQSQLGGPASSLSAHPLASSDIASGAITATELDLSISPTWTGLHTWDDALEMAEIATPSNAATGYNKLYFKSDGNLYALDENGNENQIGGTTDTRTDVSDDGTAVVTDTEDINFSTDLSVTDDGDGSVTVDDASTLDSVRGRGNSITGTLASLGTNPGAFGSVLDATVDSSPTAGTVQSYSFALDASDFIRLYAEANGSGGLQNEEIRALFDLAFPNLTGSPTFGTHDHSEGGLSTIPNAGLANSSISLTGGNAIDAIGSISLGGSATVAVSSNSIAGDELDLSISPTWTGNHTYDSYQVWQEITTPSGSPATGYWRIYVKSDGNLYLQADDGTESQIGGTTDTRTDVSDGGTTVVTDTEDINFTESGAATVNVTDDGDGSVTVDVDATDTDTQTDVSEDGTTVVSSVTDINFDGDFDVADDGDGTVTVSTNPAAELIDSPNGHIPTALLEDTESAEISVPVPNGETLTVYRWGGYKIADGTAPSGLQVQLLDGGDTVQASANTVDNENTAGVASHSNSSGSLSIFKLRVNNGTGSDLTTDGVGAVFAYEVA